jgi:thiol-disulfide isomerase/thioredoxin
MLIAEEMRDDGFARAVAENGGGGGRDGEGWFILFYMPWCGYCKEVLPVWDRLADELRGEVRCALRAR